MADLKTDTTEKRPFFIDDIEQAIKDGYGNSEQMFEYYRNAAGYEQYSIDMGKDVGAMAMAKTLQDMHLSKESRILDIGVGTGILGEKLNELGYTNIDALDAVQEMLEYTKSKDVYKEFIHETILPGKKTNIADNTYDVLCMLGAYHTGQITTASFPELIRITKPGGVIVFNVFIYTDKPDQELDSLEVELQSFVDNGIFSTWSKEYVTMFSSTGEISPMYSLILK